MTTTQPNAYDKADDNKKNTISQDSPSTTSAAPTTKRTAIKIGGMHCAGCVSAIQGYVLDLPGISKIEVNLANEKATLEYDESKVRFDTIQKTIEEVGYKVVYEKLRLTIGYVGIFYITLNIELNLCCISWYNIFHIWK